MYSLYENDQHDSNKFESRHKVQPELVPDFVTGKKDTWESVAGRILDCTFVKNHWHIIGHQKFENEIKAVHNFFLLL